MSDDGLAIPSAAPPRRARLHPALTVAGLTGLALAVGWVLVPVLPLPSLSLLFLLAVLFTAALHGVAAGIAAALLGSLAFNFFFIPPVFTLFIADPTELFALAVFLVAAVVTGGVAGRMRQEADAARRAAQTVEGLNAYAARLSGATDRATVLDATGRQLARALDVSVVLLETGPDGTLDVSRAWPEAMDLTAGERQAAREALRTGRPAPRPAEPDADLRFAFHPLASDRTPKGGAVVGVGRPLSPAPVEDAAVAAVLRHAGIALSRLAMAERANAARAEADRERVRNALLSSLSHDLRTPLATILGAATSLRELGPSMPEDARADLLEAIEDEARRLSRHVGDLLDMTRVEAGALVVKSDWTDLPDLVRTVADRARRAHPKFAIETATAAAMPLVRTDAGLVGQALFNLVDNAARHGGGHATLATGMAGREMSIVVTDDGPGLPPGARADLFTPFAAQGPRAGSGLGLAIARGMARALGGDVTCDSPVANGRGCRFTLTIPAGEGPSA